MVHTEIGSLVYFKTQQKGKSMNKIHELFLTQIISWKNYLKHFFYIDTKRKEMSRVQW